MVDFSEHVYGDDPTRGHPDCRTRLDRVSYFLLGNGLVQAAVQWVPGGNGTPLGLLVMDPDRLGRKRDALTFDHETGLAGTALRVACGGIEHVARSPQLVARWAARNGVPTVEARWPAGDLQVEERFFVPDRQTPRVARAVTVRSTSSDDRTVWVGTGIGSGAVGLEVVVPAGGEARISFAHTLDPACQAVSLGASPAAPPAAVHAGSTVPAGEEAARWWSGGTVIDSGHATLDRLFLASRHQLAAAVSRSGRLDGSIWQYNREWVRDQALVAVGLAMAGCRDVAATILARLLREFVTGEGATLDSSEVRTRDDVELDQNGVLLWALERYAAWTGDLALVSRAWERVVRVAEFPLRPEFRHDPSGLLHNSREFWERHAAYGIEPGFELVYQTFVTVGLRSAARLARALRHHREARRWEAAAERIRAAVLTPGPYALWDQRGFLKRKRLDGTVQETIAPRPEVPLPPPVPLAGPGPHLLNPDTCAVLPILFGFVEPNDALVAPTLEHVEGLWNLAWDGGGYGRYHTSSEPDSPGPWPFASLFVARAALETGETVRAARVLRWLDSVPGAPASSWFEFYGERVAPPFPQVGITPWTWSELVSLAVEQVLGIRPGLDELLVRPCLLDDMDSVRATVRVRDACLALRFRRDAGVPAPRFHVDGRPIETAGGALRVPLPARDCTIEVLLPSARPPATSTRVATAAPSPLPRGPRP